MRRLTRSAAFLAAVASFVLLLFSCEGVGTEEKKISIMLADGSWIATKRSRSGVTGRFIA